MRFLSEACGVRRAACPSAAQCLSLTSLEGDCRGLEALVSVVEGIKCQTRVTKSDIFTLFSAHYFTLNGFDMFCVLNQTTLKLLLGVFLMLMYLDTSDLTRICPVFPRWLLRRRCQRMLQR